MLLAPRSRSLLSARRGCTLAAVVVAATALAGCTSSTTQATKQTKTFTGVEGDAQKTVADMATRAANTDAAGICKNDLSTALQQSIAKAAGTCDHGVLKALDTADSLQMDVKSVQVSKVGAGQVAVAQIATPDDIGTRTIRLVRASTSGKFQIDSFDAALDTKVQKSTNTPDNAVPLTSP